MEERVKLNSLQSFTSTAEVLLQSIIASKFKKSLVNMTKEILKSLQHSLALS